MRLLRKFMTVCGLWRDVAVLRFAANMEMLRDVAYGGAFQRSHLTDE